MLACGPAPIGLEIDPYSLYHYGLDRRRYLRR
jgi:hypothetical protein